MEIIAELGSTWWRPNANKAKDALLKSIESAREVGATAVKLQLWNADKLYSAERAKAQWERARLYQFPSGWLPFVKETVEGFGLSLWASVFDVDTAKEAIQYLSAIKIASGDLTNLELIKSVHELAKANRVKFAMSTGASTDNEIRKALDLVEKPYLFQCVSAYPAVPSDYNLNVMRGPTFRFASNKVGLSDHTYGSELAKVAVGCGYTLFEKHFRLNDTLQDNPDWKVSTSPLEFQAYAVAIRTAAKMLGDGVKLPVETEMAERFWARRGLDGLRPKENADS